MIVINQKLKFYLGLAVLIIIYCVGLTGFILPEWRDILISLTVPNILFSITMILLFHQKWDFEFFSAFAAILIAGFLIEYYGVRTELLFGSYVYGETLGFKLFDIPILKGINWFLLIYVTRDIAQRFFKSPWLIAIIGTALMLTYDYTLEPFATKFDLWTWEGGDIPLHNFAGWFVFSFLIHIIYAYHVKQPANPMAFPVYLVQLIFFIVLGLFFGNWPYGF